MEKEKEVKNQLLISGCSHIAYWSSNLIFDVLWGLPPAMLALATFYIFDFNVFVDSPGREASSLLFVAYLPAMAGFAYLVSFLFVRPGVALFVSWIVNMLFGV